MATASPNPASALYLYGIVAAPGPRHLNVVGLDKQPVRVHVLGSLAFLYSQTCQERYLASRANLLAHEAVLESVMNEGHRTLLPLQFGLVVSSWDQVEQDLVKPRLAELLALLQRLEGKREVGVKVFWDPERELQLGLEENPALKARRDELLALRWTGGRRGNGTGFGATFGAATPAYCPHLHGCPCSPCQRLCGRKAAYREHGLQQRFSH
jgi:hypothetical protein